LETVALDEPCRVWIRDSWALMVLGLLVAADANPGPDPLPVRVDDIPGWAALRALLLHGVVLRDAVVAWPATTVDRVQTAGDLIGLITDQGSTWWTTLLERAAASGWAYHRARDGAELPRLDPPAPGEGLVVEQARLWGASAEAARQLAQDRSSALAVLGAVLNRVAQFIDASPARPLRSDRQTFADVSQAFLHLTGRPLKATEDLAAVHQLIVIPTPGLGAAVPVVRQGIQWTIWTAARPAPTVASGLAVHRALGILGDELNQRIIEMLAGGPAYAQGLAEPLHAHASTLSRHLNQLADAGLVTVRPEGHRVWYHLNRDALQSVGAWIADLTQGARAVDGGLTRMG
jgi:DNA-binding transcriptional ArsR family regulator